MAMALLGRNRHFHWSTILPRHFISTAKQVNYPEDNVVQLMAEMKEKTEQVIAAVKAVLPQGFPEKISEPIFSGLRRQSAKLP